jgi:hypothetical protein
MRLMKKYKDSPDWWYLVLFVIMVGLSFAVCTAWPTGFPAWAYVICIIIPVIWVCHLNSLSIPFLVGFGNKNCQLGLSMHVPPSKPTKIHKRMTLDSDC